MSLVSPFSGHGVHDVPEHVNSKGKFNLFLGTPQVLLLAGRRDISPSLYLCCPSRGLQQLDYVYCHPTFYTWQRLCRLTSVIYTSVPEFI